MKRYEKVVVSIFVIAFGLQLLNFTGKSVLFILSTWMLSLSYLIGGYWLFYSKEHNKAVLSIVAGIVFSAALIVLPQLVWLQKEPIYYFLPFGNILLFIALVIKLILKKKSESNFKNNRLILIRSVIILTISTFFTYIPMSFKPYRSVLYVLNNGREHIQNNILMFDYTAEFEDALENGDCDRAIEYSLKANNVGKLWLGRVNDDLTKADLWKISGTYSHLYLAYNCKANKEYDNNEFEKALVNYKIAHSYLTACDHNSDYWEEEKSWSLNNIAFCYKNLNQLYLADSLLMEAIENYVLVKDTADYGLAQLYSNLAVNLSEELEFSHSNLFFLAANEILIQDSLNEKNKKDLISNYLDLTINYIKLDSVKNALDQTTKALNLFQDNKNNDYCQTLLSQGLCYFKLNQFNKAETILKNCLSCFENLEKGNDQNIAETNLLLSHASFSLAKYSESRKYINKGLEITVKNYGLHSSRYANYLKFLAHLNHFEGYYPISEKQYKEVLEIYSNELGNDNYKLPEVLASLARLEITLSNVNSAKIHSDKSISIASSLYPLNTPSSSELLNSAAYVNYSYGLLDNADSIYKEVIEINKNFARENEVTTANALNGLGLIELEKRNFAASHLYFKESLKIHQSLFTDNHPFTAIVYLNLGNLLIQEGKQSEAEEIINKSMQINKQFFKSDHDVFGDLFMAMGNLAEIKKQPLIAIEHYQKALTIYTNKFRPSHWKVIDVKQKLK